MKRCVLTAVAAVLFTLMLFSAGVAPAHAATPPSGDGGISTQAEEVRWYYRNNNGVEEMRLWSLTYQRWITDWFPCPDQP